MNGAATEAARQRWSPPGSRSARAVWAITLAGLLMIGLTVWMTLRQAGPDVTLTGVLTASWLAMAMGAFLLSGAIIVARQPRNVVGWLLMVPGLALPATSIAGSLLTSIDPPPTQVDPILWVALWMTGWSWILLIFPIFALLQTFPDGRLLSPRWRWLAVLEIAMAATIIGPLSALANQLSVAQDDEVVWTVPNPIGLIDSEAVMASGFGTIWSLGLLVVTVASVVSVVIRFRRGTPEARHQLKWPMLAIAFFGIVYAVGSVNQGFQGEFWNALFVIAITAIPISVAIAVLRYRLYEIDRIISRTISYALLTVILGAAFAGATLLLGSVLSNVARGQSVAVAASTLAVFALFQPVRRRVQRVVDRRFDRARYDAERTARAFSDRLRDETDMDTVTGDLARTAQQTVAPASLAIWIRNGETSR